MRSEAETPEEYIAEVPEERKAAFIRLRETILENLPEGYIEEMNYGMIGYVVPHSVYPAGYHCDPKMPLPFANIASQKNFIGFYHMGLYADEKLMNWFLEEYPKHTEAKLDMGKSCIRFKKPNQIPFDLLGELISKTPAGDWIRLYEERFKS